MPRQFFPPIATPFLDKDGRVGIIWYQLLKILYQRLGGSLVEYNSQATVVVEGGTTTIVQSNGTPAPSQPVATTGGDSEVLAPSTGVGPWVYSSTATGALVVSSGVVSITRGSGVAQPSGPGGGSFFLSNSDKATVVYEQWGIGSFPIGVGAIGVPARVPTASFFPL